MAGKGRVYLVGAGPGDPGLLTLRGKDVLGRAEAVVYDYLSSPRLLEHAPAAARRIYVGKQASDHTLGQQEINQLLVDLAAGGLTVVRLKGGDPFVFGRGGEEALALAAAGLEFEVVPGVTSGVAGPAYAGIPVTHRGLANCVTLVTGHQADGPEGAAPDWEHLARLKGTLAFYMGVANTGEICRKLIEHGMPADMPAAIVRWATTPRQRTVVATAGTLADAAAGAKIGPPAMIVFGAVVALHEQLDWFGRRPLLGRTVVVTRARAQASQLVEILDQAGAEVIEMPAIRIEPVEDRRPLQKALRELASFDWVIFTSVNAVEAFFRELDALGLDSRALGGRRVAAIGPGTSQSLAARGIRPDLQPPTFTTAAVVEAMAQARSLAGRRILCPRSDIAPPELTDGLRAGGAVVTEVAAYRTVVDNSGAQEVAGRIAAGEIHWLTFASSSTVENFFAAVAPAAVGASAARIASIGPVTSESIRRQGLPVAVEAAGHTVQGLADAVIEFEQKGTPHV